MPIITLGTSEPDGIEVEKDISDNYYPTLQNEVEMQETVDVDDMADSRPTAEPNTESLNDHSDLEFLVRRDGSVNCKLCGKIFASRQHWNIHKDRVHGVLPPVNPVPLNECNQCHTFFKSRKGYLGHMSSKHSETLQDCTPVLQNDQTFVEKSQETRIIRPVNVEQLKIKKDLEMPILKTTLQNNQPLAPAPSRNTSKERVMDKKKRAATAARASNGVIPKESQDKRDESFVLDIIEKVRRQCETEPEAANRRGYSRKPYSF